MALLLNSSASPVPDGNQCKAGDVKPPEYSQPNASADPYYPPNDSAGDISPDFLK